MDRQDLWNDYDMLKGNINRMAVTHDLQELYNTYYYSLCALERIYTARWKILLAEKINKDKIFITQKYDETDSLAIKDFIERNEVK